MTRPLAIDRLTVKLAEALTDLLGEKVRPENVHLYPCRGYWTHKRQDVMQFTGHVTGSVHGHSIGCRESITACLRYGFTVTNRRRDRRAYADFEVSAKDRAAIAAAGITDSSAEGG